ncbi:uncharacterized protein LOC111614523 [Centruroides sculpturatus]|uniref:uncharacterized protein LOC111614523 n=1 Tax=Centruroides sculpturatus TaxID=218467 RepID=UPI000C6EA358|nr:uncharacterized protein LOC111614523 [Centruroides sculpturatus]
MRFVRKRNTFAKMNAESYHCFSNEVYSSFGYDNYVLYAYQYTIFFVPYELWAGMPEYGPNTECSESGILPEYQQCEPQVGEYGYGPVPEYYGYGPVPEYYGNGPYESIYGYGPYENTYEHGPDSENVGFGPQPDINQQWSAPEYYGYGPYENTYEHGPDSENVGFGPQPDINQQWSAPEYYGYGPYENTYEHGPDSENVGFGPQPDINQQWSAPEYYGYGPYENTYEHGPDSENVGFGPQPDINQQWSAPEYYGYEPYGNIYGYGPYENTYEHGPDSENVRFGPQPDINQQWLAIENFRYGPHSNLNEHWPAPEIINFVPEADITENRLCTEIIVYEPLVELQQSSLPTQMLEHCLQPKLFEDGKMPSVFPEYEKPKEFSRYESAALSSFNSVEPNHFSSESIHQLQKVCEFEIKDSNQSQMSETYLGYNSSAEYVNNSEKDITKEKYEKVSENRITNSKNEDTFSEFDATEEFPSKNVPKPLLSPAQITSIVNDGFTLRPLFKAFMELEHKSLVCDVIYEEEELDYESVLSETDYSIELDTISIQEKVADTINGNKLFDDCITDQNIIMVQDHSPVHETCELVLISSTSTPIYVESQKSNLTTEMYEISDELPTENYKNLADNLSQMDNCRKLIEENLIKELSDTSQEISKNEIVAMQLNENEFDPNIEVSKINENAVRDEIGLVIFEENHKKDEEDNTKILNKTDVKEIKYAASECLFEEKSMPQTQKKGVTRCVDVFRRVLRRLGNLLFPCIKRIM